MGVEIIILKNFENAIDKDGAESLGLDVSKVKYVPVFSIEECRNTIYDFLTKEMSHQEINTPLQQLPWNS